VGAELAGTSELRRYGLTDLETGEAMELVEPRASVRLRPGAEQAFEAASTSSPGAESALPCLPLATEQGTVCISRLTAGTLDDVELQLDPEQAVQLAHWLTPAVLDKRTHHRGRLRPQDITLDPAGVPRVRALGIPSPDAVLEVPRYTAPEVLRGSPPSTASGLYGLGVLLFRALTGEWPVPARNVQDLLSRTHRAVRPSSLRPGLPPRADVLVQDLLSVDPQRRVAAVRDLGPYAAAPPEIQLPRAASTPPLSTVRVPTTALATTQRVAPARRPGSHLVIAQVDDLPPSARYLAATMAGVTEQAVERAAARRQGLVVAAASSARQAAEIVERVGAHGVPAAIRGSTRTGRGLAGFLGISSITAAGISFFVSPLISLGFAAAGMVLAVVALTRSPRALRGGPAPRLNPRPEIAGLQKRVDQLALRLVEHQLPAPIALDFRGDLHRLHQRQVELATSRRELTRTLQAINDAEAGEPLRRSVAAIDQEFDQMADVLDDLEAMLASTGGAAATEADAVGSISRRLDALRAARIELAGEQAASGRAASADAKKNAARRAAASPEGKQDS